MNSLFLAQTPLFNNIQEDEIKHLLSCLLAREKTYKKNEVIFSVGSNIHEIGLVESGGVNIVVNFYWGTSSIFGHVGKGAIFGENYAAIPEEPLLCDVVATEDSKILFLDLDKLTHTCQNCCGFHYDLINNLLKISAKKSLKLSRRMMHTAPKSIRDRLLAYLSEQALANKNSHFFIPFNRQQLADYLNVDRSALSNELSKMQKDGLINFKKNEFVLKELPPDRF
jgi:CRP-like cAMP-binding protein